MTLRFNVLWYKIEWRYNTTCPFFRPHVPPPSRSVTGYASKYWWGRNSTCAPRASPKANPIKEPWILFNIFSSIGPGGSSISFSSSSGFLICSFLWNWRLSHCLSNDTERNFNKRYSVHLLWEIENMISNLFQIDMMDDWVVVLALNVEYKRLDIFIVKKMIDEMNDFKKWLVWFLVFLRRCKYTKSINDN